MAKKENHPTLFVHEGIIKHYEDGSMLQLQSLVTSEEWAGITEETIRYKVFLECLKSTGCPQLGEPWDEDDDWFRLQLDIAVSRMRNIDPLLVATYNQKDITEAFIAKMEKNATEVQDLVKKMRNEKKAAMLERYNNGDDGGTTVVSDL